MTYLILAMLLLFFSMEALGHDEFLLALVLGVVGGILAACGLTGASIWVAI